MGSNHRKRQRTANDAGGRDGAPVGTPATVSLRRSREAITIKEALAVALDGLDAIAHDAHLYHVQQEPQQAQAQASSSSAHAAVGNTGPTGWQTREDLKADVFAAMAAPHYATLRTCVVSCGLQLLPALDGVLRRVGLALATPLLCASVEAWELAALLCQYYRAGAVRLVEQLVEVLLRESGVFLLDAPCLVPSALADRVVRPAGLATAAPAAAAAVAASGGAASAVAARREWLSKVARKWRALSATLHAVGGLLPRGLLHRFAQRFTLEVLEQGLLASAQQSSYLVAQTTAMAASTGDVRVTATGVSAHSQATDSPAVLEAWTLPLEWGQACVEMLDTLLRVTNPTEPTLLTTADRLSEVLTASLHAGGLAAEADDGPLPAEVAMPSASLYADLVAATVSLQGTLRLVRDARVLPAYLPAVVTAERPKRRVQLAPMPAPTSPAPTEVEADRGEDAVSVQTKAAEVGVSSAGAGSNSPHAARREALPLPLPSSSSRPATSQPTTSASHAVTAPVSAAAAPQPPARARVPPPPRQEAESSEQADNDDMPDIDLDD